MANIPGDNGDNTLTGTNQADVIQGFGGNDVLTGRGESDSLDGGAGFDQINYQQNTQGIVAIFSGEGSGTVAESPTVTDSFTGIEGILGTDFADSFTNTASSTARFRGNGGVDNYVGWSGGYDEVDFLRDAQAGGTAGVRVDLNAGTATDGFGNNESLTSIDGARGTDSADLFIGNSGANRFDGRGGNDVFRGFAGNDVFIGGSGLDVADYSQDADFGATSGIRVNQWGAGSQGGLAADTVIDSFGATDTITEIRDIIGTRFADQIYGGVNDNTLTAGGGDDYVFGFLGNDTLNGGAGNDTIDGGAGFDTAVFSGSISSYTRTVSGSGIQITGADGTDTLTNVERLQFDDGVVDLGGSVEPGNALFDSSFYLQQNPDVAAAGIDPLQHYRQFGAAEGRDPNAYFDTGGYLAVYKDVAAAGINPLDHYRDFGAKEGRDVSLNFDTRLYLQNNPDVAAAGIDPLQHFLQFGLAEGRQASTVVGNAIAADGFDSTYYLFANPDVAAAGIDARTHYAAFGVGEGRDSSFLFDTSYYLQQNPDVAAAGIDPLTHYNLFGYEEGRDPSAAFDTTDYLAENPDVDAADINPLAHYLQYGIYEGRQAPDVMMI